MISVDTNVIVRFLTHDDEEQFKKSFRIFNSEQVFIPDTVVLETEWVLRYAYKYSPEEIGKAFLGIFGLRNVHLSNPSSMMQAIEWHQAGVDFSDALHLAHCQSHEKLFTFDRKFASKARTLTDCLVTLP